MNGPPTREHGSQPLAALLARLGLDNTALVRASSDHLTHKQVQKARKGRALTRNIQTKVLNALNAASGARYALHDLFNYRGH